MNQTRNQKASLFSWQDFKQFDVPPETLAAYCNKLLNERTTPVRLCRNRHDIIREDANWTQEYVDAFPNTARITKIVPNE